MVFTCMDVSCETDMHKFTSEGEDYRMDVPSRVIAPDHTEAFPKGNRVIGRCTRVLPTVFGHRK